MPNKLPNKTQMFHGKSLTISTGSIVECGMNEENTQCLIRFQKLKKA